MVKNGRVLGKTGKPAKPAKPPNASNPADAPEALSCPICSESMLTLAQLNRHLDDEHSEGSSLKKDTKKFGRVSERLDVVSEGSTVFSEGSSRSSSDVELNRKHRKNKAKRGKIPRSHWEKASGSEVCRYPYCGRNLGLKYGSVNCRKCGRLYCDLHTMYRMRLSESLENDTENGTWCRVCKLCFCGRDYWRNVNDGPAENLSRQFRLLREKVTGPVKLNKLNLEKRLFKLLSYAELVSAGKESAASYKAYEKSLVPWVDDKQVAACTVCHTAFTFFVRKHHCRICGSVVCADPARLCSMDVPVDMIVNIVNIKLPGQETQQRFDPISETCTLCIRLCVDCKRKLFEKRLNYKEEASSTTAALIADYNHFSVLKAQIDTARSSGSQTKLIGYFTKLEQMAKTESVKIKDMEALLESDDLPFKKDEYRLYKSFELRLISYLQENLPELRRIQQEKLEQEKRLMAASQPQKPRLTKRDLRQKREKLMVLNEQMFLIQNLHDEYKQQRKFDDLQALDDNMRDLGREIDAIRSELGDDAF